MQLIELTIACFLYLPFARAVDNELYANEQAMDA
jgi:cellobiose-specific phosphotransferase system component IIC